MDWCRFESPITNLHHLNALHTQVRAMIVNAQVRVLPGHTWAPSTPGRLVLEDTYPL
jgi:hypothetical protein